MATARLVDGVILNPLDLSVGQVVHRKVACPACDDFIFKMWPEGWDAHAAWKCSGLESLEQDDRKLEFKKKFGHLFRP